MSASVRAMTNAAMPHEGATPVSIIGSRDVARLLGIDVSTVSRRVARGELEPVGQLSSGALIFDRAAVEQLVQEVRGA